MSTRPIKGVSLSAIYTMDIAEGLTLKALREIVESDEQLSPVGKTKSGIKLWSAVDVDRAIKRWKRCRVGADI